MLVELVRRRLSLALAVVEQVLLVQAFLALL
jgi:hypothetical protein